MSSSGIHDTGPSSALQQQTGADGKQQEAGAGSFKEKQVQIVASGEEATSLSDTGGWTRQAGQVAGADVGDGIADDGDYANSFYSPGSQTGAADSKSGTGRRQPRYENVPAETAAKQEAGKAESPYQSLQPGARTGQEGHYQSLTRSGGEDNLYENPESPFGPRQKQGESSYQSLQPGARAGQEGHYQSLTRPGGEDNLYENPESPFGPGKKQGESPYQSLQPGTRGSRENQYQSLAPSADPASRSESEGDLYENPYPSSGSRPGADRGERTYQNLPGSGDAAGRAGSEGDLYENPYPSSGSRPGADGREGTYQNLPGSGDAAGRAASEGNLYENLRPSSGPRPGADGREGTYQNLPPNSGASGKEGVYQNIGNSSLAEGEYSQVQQDSEGVYESIPATADADIYSEIGPQENLYETPVAVAGSDLQQAAREARRGGLLKPLQNAVKASLKSFASGKPASRNDLKTLTKNLRLLDQLRTANGQAHATLNKLLSSNYAPEQLLAFMKNDPAFIRDITEFSRSLPRFANDPQAAARIMATLDLPAAEQERFAGDFNAAAGLLKKLYQARFDPQDANSAFRNFSDRKGNPYEKRYSQPGFAEGDSSRIRNWLAYAVSYFEDCSQIMADSARGEDPEIDVTELAKDIDRFVNRAPDADIRFGSQSP